jgi:hypothetical protein
VTDRRFIIDLAERLGWAFLEGTMAGVTVAAVSDVHMWLAALSGGVAAALSTLKSLLARRVGDPSSASLSKKI